MFDYNVAPVLLSEKLRELETVKIPITIALTSDSDRKRPRRRASIRPKSNGSSSQIGQRDCVVAAVVTAQIRTLGTSAFASRRFG